MRRHMYDPLGRLSIVARLNYSNFSSIGKRALEGVNVGSEEKQHGDRNNDTLKRVLLISTSALC